MQKFTFCPIIHLLKISIFTKFTFLKSYFSQNSHFWRLNYHKIRISEDSIFTKFIFVKSYFLQNSHFWNIIFQKIHIFETSNQGNFWIKNGVLPKNEGHTEKAQNGPNPTAKFCLHLTQPWPIMHSTHWNIFKVVSGVISSGANYKPASFYFYNVAKKLTTFFSISTNS